MEAIEFYEGLAADNSKSYWQAHKAVYDELVHRPMTELLAEIGPEFGEGKIFRPYRDVRFSRDKSPYKTAIGATLAEGGYVQFSADGLSAGCGKYVLSPGQLDRYRRAVAADGSGVKLAAIVAEAEAGRPRRSGPRQAQDLPEGLPQGSSTGRPSPLQGPDRLAPVACRGVAGHAGSEDPDHRLPARRGAAQRLARGACGFRRRCPLRPSGR